MRERQSRFQRVRFYALVGSLYLLTILFTWYVVHPGTTLTYADSTSSTKPFKTAATKIPYIGGRPVKIVIPDSAVDLPVDEGHYNPADGSWTLIQNHAYFAITSVPANNRSGSTFIYGHNNNHVFGAIRKVTPKPGAKAMLYTDNGHIFSYKFIRTVSLVPDDTSILKYSGPPILTIQTCTGSINEWRSLFSFSFDRVVQ